MIILLLVIFIVLYILADEFWCNETMGFIFGMGAIICALITFVLAVTFPHNVEQKIALYSEENTKIEAKIKDTVRVYMDYEKETYTNLVEDADLATLLIAYPQLNSNELVKTEINTYIENSKQIKYLKEMQIDKNTMAWWLYFGRGDKQ